MGEDGEGRALVLVVDDDRAVQDAVREELSHRDYEVMIVPDGESALRLVEALLPAVLVLDLQLPDVSGPIIAARLRLMEHPPKVLVCSGVPFAAEIAGDLAADGVLLKPFARADLRREVERLLGL